MGVFGIIWSSLVTGEEHSVSDNKINLISARKVQRMCGMSKSSMYRWMRANMFPRPLKIGRRTVRWREDEILKWIDSRERAHGDSPASA